MKLCFIYNDKNDKYKRLAKEIQKYFNENDIKIKIANMNLDKDSLDKNEEEKLEKNIKTYKTKNDIYVIFSDSAEELRKHYEQVKRPKKVMIITENLTVEYIMLCTDIAKDICYSKKDICDICSRIEAVNDKYKLD